MAKLLIDVGDREIYCADNRIVIDFSEVVEGGSGRVEYSLDGVTFRDVTSDTLLTAGKYTVSISDENGCTALDDFEIRSVSSDLSFAFDVTGDSLYVDPGEIFELIADVDGADRELKYEWQGTGGELLEEDKNRARFAFEHDGIIELTITDPFGCDYSDQLPVVVSEDEEPGEEETECIVSIPNAVTPNGDGINDNLEVFSDCSIQVIHIRIFDKWGGELYHVQGSEVEASIWVNIPPGVVMVQVTYETVQGVMKTVGQGVMVVK